MAEDITQETFISAYKNLDSFYNINEKAWLCRIATNKSIDYLRKIDRRQEDVLEDYKEIKSNDNPCDEVLAKDVLERFLKCCNRLDEPYKSVAIKYFAQSKTANEIATETGTKIKTVQTQIFRAREKLKISFGKEIKNSE